MQTETPAQTYELRSNTGNVGAWNLTLKEAHEYQEWFALNGVRTWVFAEQ